MSVPGRDRGRKWRATEEWVWVFQERLRALALDRRMTGSHWRVLGHLVSYAALGQHLTFKVQDVARAMGIAFQTVSRVLGELDTIGILKRVETHAYPPTYRLNSVYIYKGSGERLPGRRAHQRKDRRRG